MIIIFISLDNTAEKQEDHVSKITAETKEH